MTLSYCWGQHGQKFVLTKQNKVQFLAGIEIEQLDVSIRDAIKVTRELGFRYLWIDALCIVQDDDMEKAREISRMYKIYINAVFTIIASRSRSVTEGLLSHRKAAGCCRQEGV